MSTPPSRQPAPRFAAGTFTPRPAAAPHSRMLRAQALMELTLSLRHGEQLLITMIIPLTMLLGLSTIGISAISTEPNRVTHVLPAVLAVAVMATAFTSQAIATGFDRRYGALKRLGATALPRWGIIAGKSCAVAVIVLMQFVLLGGVAMALGWRPTAHGVVLGLVATLLGTVSFSTLGLFLGGSLKGEIVLALANLLWFVFMAFAGLVIVDRSSSGLAGGIAELTPSGALAVLLDDGFAGSLAAGPLAVLLVWGVLGAVGAARTFRFT